MHMHIFFSFEMGLIKLAWNQGAFYVNEKSLKPAVLKETKKYYAMSMS